MCSKTLTLITAVFLSVYTYSQSILDEFEDVDESSSEVSYDLTEEKVIKHSLSRRIFLITNDNTSFGQGDFITMLIQKKPVVRGLIAKLTGGGSAFKVTKVYSTELFKALVPGLTVEIIRGDDSFYRLKKKEEKAETPESVIQDEEDLFDEDSLLEDDFNDENKVKAEVRSDNLLGFGVAYFNYNGVDGAELQFQLQYGYKLFKDLWFEGNFGYSIIRDYPSVGQGVSNIDTTIYIAQARIKYAFKGPFFTIIMPYLGYQLPLSVDSPGAGEQAADGSQSDTQLASELTAVENLKASEIVLGVTVLRKLVPGWYIRLEAGTDGAAGGLVLEF